MDRFILRSPSNNPKISKRRDESNMNTSCPEDYDIEVWKSLPKDIQNELLLEAERKAKRIKGESSPIRNKKDNNGARQQRQQQPMWNAFVKEDYKNLYTDSYFPADASSIDGQKIIKSKSNQSKKEEEIKCKCGIAAMRRKVFKEGINQGRIFLTCSKTRINDKDKCDFFLWGDNLVHTQLARDVDWSRCRSSNGYIFVGGKGFDAGDIIQGSVGDCWFLSAAATIADGRKDLMKHICNNRSELNQEGKYIFNLFIDGRWTEVIVDDYLPVISKDITKHVSSKANKKNRGEGSLVYSRAKANQLWMPLLEKAYAKAHSCYDAISGGWVREALFDLTGQPVEEIDFTESGFNSEHCWYLLKHYHSQNFPMGAGTSNNVMVSLVVMHIQY